MKEKLYKLMNWPEIEAVIYSEEDNPHKLLGPHTVGSSTLLATFQPGASQVTAVIGETGKEVKMEVAVGDQVIYSKYAGTNVKLEDEEYIIVKQDDILAVVK